LKMTTKQKKKLAAELLPQPKVKATRETLALKVEKDDPKLFETIAAQVTDTRAGAAASIQKIANSEWLDINALAEVLKSQSKETSAGDMSRPEAMLLAQAQTLEALFYRFTRSGMAQDTIPQFEAHFRLALKAQSQSRMALEALAEMKNPKSIAFVKQANIAGGHQQVNNGAPSHAGEKDFQPNTLLDSKHDERMDTGTAAAAGATNPPVETVGAIHRPTNARGKSKGIAERL
ncbi:MAG: hypothetical protein ACKO15_05880, partial [Burkholderiales bacterium]